MKMTLWPMAILAATLGAGSAFAQDLEVIGKPVDGAIGLQPAVTNVAIATHKLDELLLWIIIAIMVVVLALVAVVILRYNSRANPNPSRFTHNTPLEIAWTMIPVVILVVIGAYSMPVLFLQQEIPEGEVVIKATGNQWYWSYEYVDEEFGFDSFMLPKEELAANGYTDDLYLLATDTAVVVPTGKIVVVQVTGSDVIHNWTVPAFGVKQDAVPGRLAELWFTVEPGNEGVYFGQCSELCGKDHAYMPITVKAVSEADYEAWLQGAREEYAGIEAVDPALIQVASAN